MPYTQKQLEAAYRQMQAERKQDEDFAKLAAKKLTEIVSKVDRGASFYAYAVKRDEDEIKGVTPFTTEYELRTGFYDGQRGVVKQCRDRLQKAGAKMDPWQKEFEYHYRDNFTIEGEIDLCGDPAFSGRRQAKYKVRLVHQYNSTGY
jgi:hypothetical protein